MTRYILHPGYVHSSRDGQLHMIDADQLRKLYRVPKDAQVVIHRQTMLTSRRDYFPQDGDVHLRPREDGRYEPVGVRS